MKKFLLGIFFLVAMLALTPSQAHAQSKPLKGTWSFTLTTPFGTLPVAIQFKNKEKATLSGPLGTFPVIYQEDEDTASFSIVVEIPKTVSPSGSGFTALVRGTKTTDDDATGTVFLITQTPDTDNTNNPLGVQVANGEVVGKRQ